MAWKINFKQLKYTVPLGIFPFLLFFGYNLIDLFSTPSDDQLARVVETTEINTSLPDANLDKRGIKSKYQSMLESYGKVTDRTGVDNIEREVKEDRGSEIKSAYSDRERQMLDSIEAVRQAEKKALEEQIERLQQLSAGSSEARINVPDERLHDNPELVSLREQMMLAQKLANGERILTPEQEEYERQTKQQEFRQAQVQDSIRQAQAPLEVIRAGSSFEQYFNTLQEDDQRPGLIRARVDEVLKVKEGSRIRLRLNDDVEIGGSLLPRGSYLYALVSGFGAQRVKARVSQVMVGGQIRRVDLSLYDMDGIEGLYVPNSAFRDLARNIGSEAVNLNVQTQTGGEQDLQGMALQSLQQAIQATTQAVSSHIRQNKAKIKYNTEVYLVNSRDIQ